MSAVVRITETNRGSGNRPPPRDIGSSEFRSCATIASSGLSAVPICFAPLQRALGAALRGISPSGRGWSGRLLARSMPALVTRTLERCCCRGRDAAYGRGNWPNGDRFWHADCRFRSSRCRASGGGSLVTRRSNVHHGVKELIDHHVADKSWRSILHHAREASFPPCWRRGDRASPGTRLPHRDPEPAYPGRLSSRSPHRLNGQVVHPSDVVRAGR